MKHCAAISCNANTLAVLIFLSLSPAWLFADGLLQKLPSVGTAVKYNLSQTGTVHIFESGMGDSEPQQVSMTGDGHIELAVFGSAVIAGMNCRWIEIERDTRIGDRHIYAFTKLLVPEEDIKSPGDSLHRALRIFHASDDKATPELVKSERHRQAVLAGLYEIIAKTPNAENRVNTPLREQEIELGTGMHSCAGRVFDSAADRYVQHGPHREQSYFVFRVFTHATSPTGTAYMEVHRESQSISCEKMHGLTEPNDKLQRVNVSAISRYQLLDVVQNAQSRFPDID